MVTGNGDREWDREWDRLAAGKDSALLGLLSLWKNPRAGPLLLKAVKKVGS